MVEQFRTEQLSELNISVEYERVDLAMKPARYQQAEILLRTGGDTQTIPDVLQSDVVSALRAQHAFATRLKADFARLAKWSGSARMQTQPLIYLERKPLSEYREAIRRLRALLAPMPHSRLSASPVLVTSVVPGEGKTTPLLSNDEFRSARAKEELRRTPARLFVARPIPVEKSVFPDRLTFCDSRWAAAADIAAGIEHTLGALAKCLHRMVIQVNAGDTPDKIAAEILQSFFAARQARAPQ
jgi:hypothetical protein